MDCDEGIVDQDLHLIGKVIESGRCIVLALNKVDMLSRIDRDNIKREIKRRLRFTITLRYILFLQKRALVFRNY